MPDYRGSIGYGKAWRQGVYMDVGGKDAKDQGKGGLVSFMVYPGEFHYFTRAHVLRDA